MTEISLRFWYGHPLWMNALCAVPCNLAESSFIMKNPTGEPVFWVPYFIVWKKKVWSTSHTYNYSTMSCWRVAHLSCCILHEEDPMGLGSPEFPGALLYLWQGCGGSAGPWIVTEGLDLYPWNYLTFPALVKFCLPYLNVSMIEHGKRNLEKVSSLLWRRSDLCSHLPEKVAYSTN